jgi:hypothetical protein
VKASREKSARRRSENILVLLFAVCVLSQTLPVAREMAPLQLDDVNLPDLVSTFHDQHVELRAGTTRVVVELVSFVTWPVYQYHVSGTRKSVRIGASEPRGSSNRGDSNGWFQCKKCRTWYQDISARLLLLSRCVRIEGPFTISPK